ncbi:uncharacterized protein [Bemisia tabaci]|uniref:uncharacterized protein n=1 Tax=Bemisia tabaci TaxID=7038 RepID=UPI003B27D3DE
MLFGRLQLSGSPRWSLLFLCYGLKRPRAPRRDDPRGRKESRTDRESTAEAEPVPEQFTDAVPRAEFLGGRPESPLLVRPIGPPAAFPFPYRQMGPAVRLMSAFFGESPGGVARDAASDDILRLDSSDLDEEVD